MYRVGFGDFFLVTFLNAGKPLHIVIDCGVFKGTKQTGDIGSIEAAVADMAKTTSGQLELIIMTHRHADHIAGFARCANTFKGMKVGAVWMSIWESEYEPTAAKFQAALTSTARGLQRHFNALGARETQEQATARKYLENATGESVNLAAAAQGANAAAAQGSNAVALNLLKHGFANVVPKYYKAGDRAELPQSLVQAGVATQILGPPPVQDVDLMTLMDLQKGVGQYLTESGEGGSDESPPFGPEWEFDPGAAYAGEAFREWVERPRSLSEDLTKEQAQQARSRMEGALKQTQPAAALVAAKQLNSFLNNQSLVILFTFKGKKLLFVGDAQAGNWEHWLFDTDKPDKQVTGGVTDAAKQILTSLDFYKVGHHGSGNATPMAAANMLCEHEQKFAAMCSTQAGVYGTEDPEDTTKGTEVPRVPLLQKLSTQAALVRSDQIPITVNGKSIKPQVPAAMPAAIPGSRFQTGALWVDCFL
jgi:hypothetical protein